MDQLIGEGICDATRNPARRWSARQLRPLGQNPVVGEEFGGKTWPMSWPATERPGIGNAESAVRGDDMGTFPAKLKGLRLAGRQVGCLFYTATKALTRSMGFRNEAIVHEKISG